MSTTHRKFLNSLKLTCGSKGTFNVHRFGFVNISMIFLSMNFIYGNFIYLLKSGLKLKTFCMQCFGEVIERCSKDNLCMCQIRTFLCKSQNKAYFHR